MRAAILPQALWLHGRMVDRIRMALAVDGSVGGSLLFKHDSLSSGLSSDSGTYVNPGIVL